MERRTTSDPLTHGGAQEDGCSVFQSVFTRMRCTMTGTCTIRADTFLCCLRGVPEGEHCHGPCVHYECVTSCAAVMASLSPHGPGCKII